ncbi:uncharacterized protein L203_100705 [Cryptococcus depauperatus CBS 7841]|uniref:Uncharacterized protein n=1 Tax=Cryptococcus depauperatus CBS 7841 TaxID=1295531 RepID=A0AAJ8JNJ5_9TREE
MEEGGTSDFGPNDPVMWRLLTFPLLTVGAISGHVFAGGMILALRCDYCTMASGIRFMCMSELTFGASLPKLINMGLMDEAGGHKAASRSWGLIKECILRLILESCQSYKPVVQPKEAEKKIGIGGETVSKPSYRPYHPVTYCMYHNTG